MKGTNVLLSAFASASLASCDASVDDRLGEILVSKIKEDTRLLTCNAPDKRMESRDIRNPEVSFFISQIKKIALYMESRRIQGVPVVGIKASGLMLPGIYPEAPSFTDVLIERKPGDYRFGYPDVLGIQFVGKNHNQISIRISRPTRYGGTKYESTGDTCLSLEYRNPETYRIGGEKAFVISSMPNDLLGKHEDIGALANELMLVNHLLESSPQSWIEYGKDTQTEK